MAGFKMECIECKEVARFTRRELSTRKTQCIHCGCRAFDPVKTSTCKDRLAGAHDNFKDRLVITKRKMRPKKLQPQLA